MKYLVDTNILIYLMNSKSVKLLSKFTKRNPEQFCVSSITVAELIYGAKKSKRIDQNIEAAIKVLSPFTIIDFTGEDAFEYGDIRAELESRGNIIGGNDLLISSQARRQNLTVITANVKEYERVPRLKVENWATDINK